jgi:flagellar biosynthesis protein FlhG
MNDQAEKLRQIIEHLKLKNSEAKVEVPIKKSARVITVTSGKGGVGKTNITINLAIALSEMGLRVVILDADFGLANIDILFGIIPRYTLVDVMKNKKNILEVLSEGPQNIKFISGGSGVEDLVRLEKHQLMSFIDNIALLDKISDIILIDTGAGLSESVMSFVMAADDVLLVTTPEPTSITDAYALIKLVSHRDKNKEIKVLVNRAENSAEANDILNKLSVVSEKFLEMKLHRLGYVQSDEYVVKAVKQQKPFMISYPKCNASRQTREISAKLFEENEVSKIGARGGIKGFMKKLVGVLGT